MFSNVSPCTSLYDLVFSRIPCTPMHPLYNHVFPCIYMYPHLFPCTHDCLIYPPILPHNPVYVPVSLVLSCVHLYSYLFYFVLTVPPVFLFTTHAGPAEGTKLHARKNFCVFYPIELKLCTMIELFIPNNRIVFVFLF